MTVGKLIEKLKEYDSERIVVLAKDREGNAYSPADKLESCGYTADTTWSGEIGYEELTDEDRADGWTEDDLAPPGYEKAVAIWPVN